MAAAVVVNRVLANPAETLTRMALVPVGLPVYFFWGRHRPPRDVTP